MKKINGIQIKYDSKNDADRPKKVLAQLLDYGVSPSNGTACYLTCANTETLSVKQKNEAYFTVNIKEMTLEEFANAMKIDKIPRMNAYRYNISDGTITLNISHINKKGKILADRLVDSIPSLKVEKKETSEIIVSNLKKIVARILQVRTVESFLQVE